jgi:hypothetical protein
MNNTVQSVAKYFQKNVSWHSFFSLVDNIGDSLNSPKLRFLKSDLIERAIAKYSKDGLVKYVNLEGIDFILEKLGTTLEMKYSSKSLYTNKKKLKGKLSNIRLVNTNGNYMATKLPDTYSDFLMVADLNGVVIIDKETLNKYLFFGIGFIEARNVPMSAVTMVVGTHSNIDRKKTQVNIKEKYEDMQNKILEENLI